MSQLPHMPLYPADFFADTEDMNPDAAKAYLFLLCHAWLRHARLDNDDAKLARLARVSPRQWASLKKEVMAMFTLGADGIWYQERLTKEYEKACRKADVNRKNGAAGGQAKSAKNTSKNNDHAVANANGSLVYARATPEPEPEPEGSQESRKARESTETPNGVAEMPLFGEHEEPDLDALFYSRGKRLLGKKAGGQLTKLRAAVGSVGVALDVIEQARSKDSAAEYVAGVIRAKGCGTRSGYRDPVSGMWISA